MPFDHNTQSWIDQSDDTLKQVARAIDLVLSAMPSADVELLAECLIEQAKFHYPESVNPYDRLSEFCPAYAEARAARKAVAA